MREPVCEGARRVAEGVSHSERGLDDSSLRPDRNGVAAAVRPGSGRRCGRAGALGRAFGEMSTFMNYTFQSFNFRQRQGARPFYDLVANIAAEEFGHVELVATTINTMLTGPRLPERPGPLAAATRSRSPDVKGIGNPQHFIAGGQGALPQDSNGRPWNGDYVFSSGDLIEDLTHNFFLETGARNNKLKVYEMVEHPAARALTGLPARPRRRPPGRVRAGDREPDRRRPDEAVPHAADPDREDPGVQAAHQARRSPPALSVLAERLPGAARQSSTARTRRRARSSSSSTRRPEGVPPRDLPAQPAVFAPDYAPEEIAEIAAKLRERGRPAEGADRHRRRAEEADEARDEEGDVALALTEHVRVAGTVAGASHLARRPSSYQVSAYSTRGTRGEGSADGSARWMRCIDPHAHTQRVEFRQPAGAHETASSNSCRSPSLRGKDSRWYSPLGCPCLGVGACNDTLAGWQLSQSSKRRRTSACALQESRGCPTP